MAVSFRCTLLPQDPPLRARDLLEAWMRANLEPRACREAVERMIEQQPSLADLLDPSAVTHGGLVATRKLMTGVYGKDRPWQWRLGGDVHEIAAEAVASVADLIRMAGRAPDRGWFAREAAALGDDPDVLAMVMDAIEPGEPHGRWPDAPAPGIYRREHASLLIRTPETTLVTDPQCLSRGWTTNNGQYPADANLPPARVLLTHSHNDHWDLASAMFWGRDRPVVVPRMPFASLLAADLRSELELADHPVESPDWWFRINAGDTSIEVLPFFGEQPTRDLRLPDGVRNWGNCYRFEGPGISLLLLVDSGADAEGRMVDAVRRSVAAYGPIDTVMSCCFEFPEALNPGLPHYALVVPFDELRRRWEAVPRASMTSGPVGLAEICEAARARLFMPYAHGFAGLGRSPSSDEGGGMTEDLALDLVEAALRKRGAKTEVRRWNPGDKADLS